MNAATIKRAARSLAFRRRLAEGIEPIEHALIQEMKERDTTGLSVPGYKVTIDNYQIVMTPVDDVIPGQLELPINATEEEIDNWLALQDPDLE